MRLPHLPTRFQRSLVVAMAAALAVLAGQWATGQEIPRPSPGRMSTAGDSAALESQVRELARENVRLARLLEQLEPRVAALERSGAGGPAGVTSIRPGGRSRAGDATGSFRDDAREWQDFEEKVLRVVDPKLTELRSELGAPHHHQFRPQRQGVGGRVWYTIDMLRSESFDHDNDFGAYFFASGDTGNAPLRDTGPPIAGAEGPTSP